MTGCSPLLASDVCLGYVVVWRGRLLPPQAPLLLLLACFGLWHKLDPLTWSFRGIGRWHGCAGRAAGFLLTFGFEIIVDRNSGGLIVCAAPVQRLLGSLPATYREGFYSEYMQRVFKYLGRAGHATTGPACQLLSHPLSLGMGDMLQLVAK